MWLGLSIVIVQGVTIKYCMTSNTYFSCLSNFDSSWLRGAMVARLTPDQKAACSNHVGVTNCFCFLIPQPSQRSKKIFKYMNKIGFFHSSQCLAYAENSTMSINQKCDLLYGYFCTLFHLKFPSRKITIFKHLTTCFKWSCSVVVITSALHAEGPQFEPGRDQ